MMAMKKRKQIEIDDVIDSRRNDAPTVQDLMQLFGPVGEDSEGKPFIFAEDDDTVASEHLRMANMDEEDEEQAMGNEE